MDSHLQQLKRDQSPEGQARLLLTRRRLGNDLLIKCECKDGMYPGGVDHSDCNGTGKIVWPWDKRIKLAAYCGHVGAQHLTNRHIKTEDWILGLNKSFGVNYPIEVLEQAALAACEIWLERHIEECYRRRGGRGAGSFALFGIGNKFIPQQKALIAAKKFIETRNYREDCRVYSNDDPCQYLAWCCLDYQLSTFRLSDTIRQCGDVRPHVEQALIKWALND